MIPVAQSVKPAGSTLQSAFRAYTAFATKFSCWPNYAEMALVKPGLPSFTVTKLLCSPAGAPMLLVEGQPLIRNAVRRPSTCIVSHLVKIASVQSQAEQFLDRGLAAPQQVNKVLHVMQGEYAVVNTAQEPKPWRVCSSEATTCCILALRCRCSGRVGMIHCDQPRAEQSKHLEPLLHDMVEPELYMVGGFLESSGCGTCTANTLLSTLEETELPVQICLACIGALNTTATGRPRCCSLSLTQEEMGISVSPCREDVDKGPQAIERLARIWASSEPRLEQIYDTARQTLRISGVIVHLTKQQLHSFTALLKLPDEHLLRLVSTSPEHEAGSFVQGDGCSASCCKTYTCSRTQPQLSNVLFAETRAVFEWLLSRHEADALNHKQAEPGGVSKYMWSGTWQLIVPTSSN